jgi:pimeloyl-ACP methyl ester carboxylesterase
MNTRTINGTSISFEERGVGRPGAPPIVLLHGFPLEHRMWEAQLSGLSRSFRVIAADLRGFGRSPCEDAFTIPSLADDVHGLLESLGALPCVLCGLSMGGYVALAYVRKYPTTLRGLILVATKAEADAAPAREGRQKMIDAVRAGGSKAIADAMEPKLLAEATLRGRPDVVRSLRGMMEGCPPGTIERALVAMRDRPDQTDNLPSIPVPTLVLVGEHDAITPPDVARAMHSKIPNAQLEVIPGAGHMAPMEQPDAVTRAIERFVAGIGA